MFATTGPCSAARCKTVTTCSAGSKNDGGFPLFPLTFLKRQLERQVSHKEAGSSVQKGLSGNSFSSHRGSHAGKPFSTQDSAPWPRGARNVNAHDAYDRYPESSIGEEVAQSLVSSLVEDDLAPAEPDVLSLEFQKVLKEVEAKSALGATRLQEIEAHFNAMHVSMMPQAKRGCMASRLLPNANAESRKLIEAHTGESRSLLNEHLKHVASHTDPVMCGIYQLQMPSMEGYGAIAIPHVFLEQIFRLSASFGYALRRAERSKSLDILLVGHSQPLQSYMCSDLPVHPGAIAGALAQQVVAERAALLFGRREELVDQVEEVFSKSKSSDEAQRALDRAMRGREIDWVFISNTHLRRIALEACAFGEFLWDADIDAGYL
mmetsp:Transcript_121/g.283  ORF Transcript_121/g.283 Transcript_121/m.283 type:complete len:377 (-) Transcript_121:465-1595(-)|eukprot:CAMPEP_0118932312 /NCGR_PEP_ID=MMETSP1169-20130426/9836_1 /TAXON_ID=36882 /ORGANISM="Pyramimonas obovata, Strain CCMP722" /LENGTH=376 /DNA_ID=CAMNT_0006874951 /DNA_START=176 /DNA_END=1306 /DNA_ORIENTATION=+